MRRPASSLELRPAVSERAGELVVPQRGQQPVGAGVEADLEAGLSEGHDIRRPHAGRRARRPRQRAEQRLDARAALAGHDLDPARKDLHERRAPVGRVASVEHCPHQVPVRPACVDHALELLPPKLVRLRKRRSAQEEARGQPLAGQQLGRKTGVAVEIVVEGDRQGERLAPAAARRSRQNRRRRDNAVAASGHAELSVEKLDSVGRHELALPRPRLRADAVVRKRHASGRGSAPQGGRLQ